MKSLAKALQSFPILIFPIQFTALPPELQSFVEWLVYTKDEPEETEKPPTDQSELLYKTPNQADEELIEELRDKPEGKDIVDS